VTSEDEIETLRREYNRTRSKKGPPQPSIAFTKQDTDLFARYRAPVRWTIESVPDQDQSSFRSIRDRLKALSKWISDGEQSADLADFVSVLTPSGYAPRELWCCVYSKSAPNKSYSLQVAIIISPTGAEACICLGAGYSDLSGEPKEAADQYFAQVREALRTAPPSLVDEVSGMLPEDVQYLKEWNLKYVKQPKSIDPQPSFSDLRAWLNYAASENGASASISVLMTPEELEAKGAEIANLMQSMTEAAVPLFRHIQGDEGGLDAVQPAPRSRDFVWRELKSAARESRHNLILDDGVYKAVTAALRAGKHVILTGPPGTAKTTLAEVTASLAAEAGLCEGHLMTTATADWTTYDTIGGLQPALIGSALAFHPGHFLEAAASKRWLIIDELNRSNFDRAFGQLFTVLSGQSVVLPYEDAVSGKRIALVMNGELAYPASEFHTFAIPENWRILATMNIFDKSLLFEMSYALMRRFAFIEVPAPSSEQFQQLWERQLDQLELSDIERISGILTDLLSLRTIKDVGPAVFIDMARFARQYVQASETLDEKYLAYQLFYSYLLPQFEGINAVDGRKLFTDVRKIVGSDHSARLRKTLVDVLGLSLPKQESPTEGATDVDLEDADVDALDQADVSE
jgi:MoxR-like ATPase